MPIPFVRLHPCPVIPLKFRQYADLMLAEHVGKSPALPTFSDCGYDVTINGRFIGGEMLLRYGWPEINQGFFQANVPIP